MIFREGVTVIIFGVVVLAFAVGYISSIFLGDDNKVEQVCEEVIKLETGTTVDITPASPEPGASGLTGPEKAFVDDATAVLTGDIKAPETTLKPPSSIS